jgi:hypothetical protein
MGSDPGGSIADVEISLDEALEFAIDHHPAAKKTRKR